MLKRILAMFRNKQPKPNLNEVWRIGHYYVADNYETMESLVTPSARKAFDHIKITKGDSAPL